MYSQEQGKYTKHSKNSLKNKGKQSKDNLPISAIGEYNYNNLIQLDRKRRLKGLTRYNDRYKAAYHPVPEVPS
jgi:hypothetical protein